jgi:hypothetical protein
MVQHTKYFLMQIRGSSMILLGMRRECPATALGVHRVTELILEVSNSEAHVFMELDQGLKENIPSLSAGSLIDRLEGKALRTGLSSFLLLKRDVHQSQNLTAGADLQNNLDGWANNLYNMFTGNDGWYVWEWGRYVQQCI